MVERGRPTCLPPGVWVTAHTTRGLGWGGDRGQHLGGRGTMGGGPMVDGYNNCQNSYEGSQSQAAITYT